MKKRTLLDRIRDAIRAFRGKQIGSVTFGIDVKRCSECERNSEVLYLCDGRACGGTCPNPDCHHTNDICHAKNFEYNPHGRTAYWELDNTDYTPNIANVNDLVDEEGNAV